MAIWTYKLTGSVVKTIICATVVLIVVVIIVVTVVLRLFNTPIDLLFIYHLYGLAVSTQLNTFVSEFP